jgi:hypothetical protein
MHRFPGVHKRKTIDKPAQPGKSRSSRYVHRSFSRIFTLCRLPVFKLDCPVDDWLLALIYVSVTRLPDRALRRAPPG